MNPVSPIFFEPNRVRRSYAGGKQLREFMGEAGNADDHFPEDLLLSSIDAAEESQAGEGVARLQSNGPEAGTTLCRELENRAETILGANHIENFGLDFGMTCRLIDPAERLPIECCPDGIAYRKLYGVQGEGAKSWYVVRTREINDELPYVLLGFKEHVTPEVFAQAVSRQDSDALVSMMHKIPVRQGETYFIPAGMPHAMGPGVLAFETRDQYAYSVIVEKKSGKDVLTDSEMWGHLSVEQGLSIFDYSCYTVDEVVKRTRMEEHVMLRSDEGLQAELVGSERTGGFALWRVEAVGRLQVKFNRPFAMALCVAGEGRINWADGTRELKSGEFFLQPYTVPWIEYIAFGRLSLVVALPPIM